MTAPESPDPTDDVQDREGADDVVLTTDEDEQRDDLPVQPGNS